MTFLFTKTPLIFLTQSFWRDEAFTYLLAKRNIFQIIFLTAKDFNPPLYYLILNLWMKIFGSSEIALRSLSFVFFWAAIYVVFLFLNKILKISHNKSLLYLLLFVTNPLLAYYAFEARMYTLFAFLATLSFYSFYKKDRQLYLISTTLGLFTHYFMILVVFSQVAFTLLFEKGKDKLVVLKNSLKTLLFFLPWILFVLILKGLKSEPFWITNDNAKSLTSLLTTIYTGYEKGFRFFGQSLTFVSLILIFLILIGVYKYKFLSPQKKHQLLLLIFWSLLPPLAIFLVSFIKPLFLSRYLIFADVGFILLIVFILEEIKLIPQILIMIILLFININYQQYEIKNRQKGDIRKTIHEIKVLAKNNDLLYVRNELDFHTAQYYFDENRVFIYEKSYDKIPSYVGKILIPEEKITFNLPRYPKKAFILNENGSYDIRAVY